MNLNHLPFLETPGFLNGRFEVLLSGTSLVIQWLGFHVSNAGGAGSLPSQGTQIPHAVQCSQNFFLKVRKKEVFLSATLHYLI